METAVKTAEVANRGAYFQSVARNLFLIQEFFVLVEAFSQNKIRLIPLKGIALLDGIYKDLSQRYIGDLDILIKTEDIQKATSVLHRLGYTSPSVRINLSRPYSAYLNSLAFSKPSAINYFVHLHWHISNSTFPLFMYRIDMRQIWQGARPYNWQGKDFLMMSPAHTIVYLCLHAFSHDYDDVKLFKDIKNTVEFYRDELEWNQIIAVSRRWNVATPLYYSLYLSAQLAGLDVPEEVVEAVKPPLTAMDKRILSWITKNGRGYHNQTFSLYLRMAGSLFNRLKFVFLSVFIPLSVMMRIGAFTRPASIIFYYAKRIFRGRFLFFQSIVTK